MAKTKAKRRTTETKRDPRKLEYGMTILGSNRDAESLKSTIIEGQYVLPKDEEWRVEEEKTEESVSEWRRRTGPLNFQVINGMD